MAEPNEPTEPSDATERESPEPETPEPDAPDRRPTPAWRRLRRNGPLALVLVIAVAVAGFVVLGDGDDGGSDQSQQGDPGSPTGYTVENDQGDQFTLPEGVVPFSVAQDEGLDVDWPETCDTEQGRFAVPNQFPPECYAPFRGDNGGATATGVTEDSIKVVIYEPIEDDPVLEAIIGLISNDTPAQLSATYQEFLPYFHEFYETYGREVELVVYRGTGTAIDEVAARADAVRIAEEIQPFAVLDGPQLTSTFADELAAREILNIGYLGGGWSPDYYVDADPYLFQLAMGPMQLRQHLGEYIGKRLAGDPAEHAGDDQLAQQERRFGLVNIDLGPESEQAREVLEETLASYGVELAATATYENPLDVSTEAPGIVARMKDAGVTSVILVGDPLTPATFTRIATDQEYFPEWIVSGAALTDSTIYARSYDQEQWAHAFGITSGAARLDPSLASSRALFEWYSCTEPSAPDGVEIAGPMLSLMFAVIQGIGPELSPESFRNGLFVAEPTAEGLSVPSLSYGLPNEMSRWEQPDYQGIDDATEIWWDPEATGPDETGSDGEGMYRYVDGGERFLPGEWPEAPAGAFEPDEAVAMYTEAPPGEAYPEYPSPC